MCVYWQKSLRAVRTLPRSPPLLSLVSLLIIFSTDGMERVVCISHAKVPIVKIWDPELRLACDMNVNNTMALENTRMVRTYVEIDERVRPLAMIIKNWTKRRILNDAGRFLISVSCSKRNKKSYWFP